METLVHVPVGNITLEGLLVIPKDAKQLVLFAHGSGSSRFSPRNNFVARILQKNGLGTLLIDLLLKEEDAIYETRFDIGLLTKRLIAIVEWLEKDKLTQHLLIGLFGASTGAAAALQAAAVLKQKIRAVVSRGGRPDLAIKELPQVTSPTLLIVGGNDFGVIELNQQAYDALHSKKQFAIVPNATHLFEEPGCLEKVSDLATKWFQDHLK